MKSHLIALFVGGLTCALGTLSTACVSWDSLGTGDLERSADADAAAVPSLRSCGTAPSGTEEARLRYLQEQAAPGVVCAREVQRRRCHDGAWSPWSGSFAFADCWSEPTADAGHDSSVERRADSEAPVGPDAPPSLPSDALPPPVLEASAEADAGTSSVDDASSPQPDAHAEDVFTPPMDALGNDSPTSVADGQTADASTPLADASDAPITLADSGTPDRGVPELTLLAGRLLKPGQDGMGAAAQITQPNGAAADGEGNLFIADTGNHTIRRIVLATAAVTTVAGSAGISGGADGVGSSARFSSPRGIASGGAGTLFVADTDNHTIRKILLATGEVSTVAGAAGRPGSADGVGSSAQFDHPYGLCNDGRGSLFVSDTYNQTIRKISLATGDVTTVAGSVGSRGSADGVGGAARFETPTGIACEGAVTLFVADTGNETVRQISVATGEVTTIAGTPGARGSTDGTGPAARFATPRGVIADGAGNVFVADAFNGIIRRIALATRTVTTLAGSVPDLLESRDGVGPDAWFNYPLGLALDGQGNLLVAEEGDHAIRNVVIATGEVTTVAGIVGNSSYDGVGAAARFSQPMHMATDEAGNAFVADSYHETIRKIVLATGDVTTVAGLAAQRGSADGIGPNARFDRPVGLAFDGDGSLLVGDIGNHAIRRVVLATGEVSTLAGSAGSEGSADGIGANARFYSPVSLVCDRAGNLFAADSPNHTIRKIVLATGEVTTLAGSPGSSGNADGFGSNARFYYPISLALDGSGNLYVGDSDNHTIRKIVVSTAEVTTFVGSGQNGYSDGVGPAAWFTQISALAYDGAGSLFAADAYSASVRKVDLATGVVTTVVGRARMTNDIELGPLPANLQVPSGVAWAGMGRLLITVKDYVLLARF